jgi:hypothetical protein
LKTSTKRRVAAIAGAVGIGATAALGPSSPAAADSYDGKCNVSEVCLYWGYDYTRPLADFTWDIGNYDGWRFHNSAVTLNDNVASLKCLTFFFSCQLWEHANYSGAQAKFNPGGTSGNLGIMVDRGSSHRFVP